MPKNKHKVTEQGPIHREVVSMTLSFGGPHIETFDPNYTMIRYHSTKVLERADVNSQFGVNAIVQPSVQRNNCYLPTIQLIELDLRYGYSPLHIACRSGQKDAVTFLIKAGANVNANALLQDTYYNSVEGPVPITPIGVAFEFLVRNYSEEIMRDIIYDIENTSWKNVEDLVNISQSEEGKIYREMVAKLIEAGADVNTHEFQRFTIFPVSPLHLASIFKWKEFLRLLIEAGADVNARLTFNRSEYTALDLAVWNGSEDIASLLIEAGASVHKSHSLKFAFLTRNYNLVKMVIEAGAKFDYESIENASRYENRNVVSQLLDKGVDVNGALQDIIEEIGFEENSLLTTACVLGNAEIVSLLLTAGADAKVKTGHHTYRNRDEYVKVSDCDMLEAITHKFLIRRFAVQQSDPEGTLSLLDIADGIHDSRWVEIARAHHISQSGEGSAFTKMAIDLVSSGAKPDRFPTDPDDYEKSHSSELNILHIASIFRWNKLVSILIKAGANVNMRYEPRHDERGFSRYTPLDYASWSGSEYIVKQLVKAGADVNAADSKNGLTALHHASRGGHEDVVSHLIKAGAYVDVYDYKGLTPLHMAAMYGHKKVMSRLIATSKK